MSKPKKSEQQPSLVAQKVAQAQAILRESKIDCWLVQFAQETGSHPDPVQNLLVGTDVTWLSAFLIPAHGKPVAIVGSLDAEKVRGVGAYPEVIGYVQGIAEPLITTLARMKVVTLGITTSRDDHAADGITLGNYQRLQKILRSSPLPIRVVPAGDVVARVRGRKLPDEVRRIREACRLTEELFAEITLRMRPGVTGRAIADFAHEWMRQRNLTPSWDADSCPTVPIGPKSPVGHVPAGDIAAVLGDLIFCDVGVATEGYRSDMQRTWYLLREGEDRAPEHIQRAWDALMSAVDAGVKKLTPGTKGWQVDAAARATLVKHGFAEPTFSFGHHLGANTHDGAGVLGPRWERYGRAPFYPVEIDQVYAVEYGIPSPDPYAGWVSVEDDLLITADGVEWMVPPQRELRLLRS